MNFNYPNMNMPPPLPPPQAPEVNNAVELISRDVKTVPFLRSLVEMLIINSDLISFVPGETAGDGTKLPGQVIIHDRNRVQSEVLPFYFNHASFASFRRNLSYFSFVRLGKGRHSGAVTYVNDAVFELTDILLLKRRAVGCPPGGATPKTPAAAVGGTEPQEQQQQPEEEEGEPSKPSDKLSEEPPASQDVASAVISGRMHACETNHDLDNTENKKFSTMMLSSKSVSAITLGTKSRGELTSSKSSSKSSLKKKRRSSKYKNYTKGGSRVYRLLHANGIVPFIHLPAKVKGKDIQGTSSGLKVEGLVSFKKAEKRTNDGSDENYKVRGNKKARFQSSSGSSSNSSGNELGDVSASMSKNSSSTSGNEGGDAVPAAAAGPRKNQSSSTSVADALLALRSGP
jgi:hypothetical protein